MSATLHPHLIDQGAAAPLHLFQDAFAGAVRGHVPAHDAVARLAALPAFAVYRNTVAKGCLDALVANFPTVRRLVGDDWFSAAARAHAAAMPPSDARLLHYGADFPQFLAGFPPAAELPYLPGVAELDRLWVQSHVAADDPLLEAGALAGVPLDALLAAVLQPHAATRWRAFDGEPVGAIWRVNRDGVDHPVVRRGEGDAVLLTRPDGAVRWLPFDAAGCAFLSACAAGEALGDAAEQAMATACGPIDLASLLAQLLRAGAFTRIVLPLRSTP